jgi:hypothetical protein
MPFVFVMAVSRIGVDPPQTGHMRCAFRPWEASDISGIDGTERRLACYGT